MASLEGSESALAFSSGMAALAAVVLGHMGNGDHLISTDVIYGGTYGLLQNVLPRYGIEVSFADSTDPEAVSAAIRGNTRMILLESPSNPILGVTDIAEIAGIARDNGALTVVDNTFASPCLQRPLELGADVVVESCTKYIGGHSDLLGGIAACKAELVKPIRRLAVSMGGTMGTAEAWLCLRGLKTLHLRMERHCLNALALARFLEDHPLVEKVMYPGLKSHPQHELAARQMAGPGGMLSFQLSGGRQAVRRMFGALHLCAIAVSLGAVDTLIEHPASMTHAVMPKPLRLSLGISDGLVRISAGIEDALDIQEDLRQALNAVS